MNFTASARPILFFFAVISALATSPQAFSWPITFGSEFEFTSHDLIEHGDKTGATISRPNSLEKLAAEQFYQSVKKRCPECTDETVNGKWGPEKKIGFDNWWFQISYDPSCVEVLTKPSTLAELRKLKSKINYVLFGAAIEDNGFFADPDTGAGHLNFGATSAYGNDSGLFLKYFADFSNHPVLATGALGWDYSNAPAMASLTDAQRTIFSEILKEAHSTPFDSVKSAATAVQTRVYTWTTDNAPRSAHHYQALSVKKLNRPAFPEKDAPMEIRAMFAQDSEDDFILDAEILERRIAFLKQQPGQLVYLQMPVDALDYQEIIDIYYKYLTEMGLDWKKYRKTMYHDFAEYEPGDFVQGNVRWSKTYADSVLKFAPYMQTSKWVRDRVFQSFTDVNGARTVTAAKTLPLLIDAIDINSPYARTSFSTITRILNHPRWKNKEIRSELLALLKSRKASMPPQNCPLCCEEAVAPEAVLAQPGQ